MIRICFVVLFLVFQSACTVANSPDSQALQKFQASFVKEIQCQYGFEAYSSGASIPVNIEWIGLSFYAGHSASIDEGRKLVVSITNRFIHRMNEDENVLKYLSNPPASLRNVDLTIRFDENSQSPLQSIMIIGSKNLVVYNKYDEKRRLVDLHRETFDEAERIVEQETASKLNNPRCKDVSN